MTGPGLTLKRRRCSEIISELARAHIKWLRRGARQRWLLAFSWAPGCRLFVRRDGPRGSRRRARPHGGDDRGPREAGEFGRDFIATEILKVVGDVPRHEFVPDRVRGAAAGAIGLMLALFVLFPDTSLKLVALLGLLAAPLGISLRESGTIRKGRTAVCSAAAIAACAALPSSWTALHLSEYKGLSQALLVPGARVLAEDSSPLGLLTVVSSPTIPLRHAPGLSLYNTAEPPAQLGVFTDGDGLTAITAFDGRREPLNYLDSTSTALPYHLLEKPEVLILGAGGGTDILLALLHDAPTIDAVEINPQLVRLVAERFAAFAGHLYERPGVRVHVTEARSFIASRRDRYDVIQIPLLDSFAAAAAGTHSLSESYVYTIEAFEQYLDHLRPAWQEITSRAAQKSLASHVSGLFTQSGWTAGPDGVREPRPHHSSGIDVPMNRQASLGCVGSTDCAITRHYSLASSSTGAVAH
jgi:hypothetical protein